MAYGDPIAVSSAYGDTVLDLPHATIVYTLAKKKQISGPAFWVWLRDLDMKQAESEMYGESDTGAGTAEHEFASQVGRGEWPDPENATGEKLFLLREGHAGEQEMLNEGHCTKCLVPLQSLCKDYP
jgi:hypothetical protein